MNMEDLGMMLVLTGPFVSSIGLLLFLIGGK